MFVSLGLLLALSFVAALVFTDMTSSPQSEQTIGQDGAAPQLTVEQAIANLKQTEDKGDRYYAAWWLGRFNVDEPEAVSALIAALQDESDRDTDGGYPLRRNAARALGKLGDLSAVPALLNCLDCDDYYVREAAAQSLASLNAKESISPLVALLNGGVEAAVDVPGKPHLVQPYNAILEALGDLGDDQTVAVIEAVFSASGGSSEKRCG